MGEYRLSFQAEDDLFNIYAWTELRFGRYQADAYLAGLERSFDLLADFPLIGTSAEILLPKLRRFRFQSHYIFYDEGVEYLLIRALIHVKMNLRPSLFK